MWHDGIHITSHFQTQELRSFENAMIACDLDSISGRVETQLLDRWLEEILDEVDEGELTENYLEELIQQCFYLMFSIFSKPDRNLQLIGSTTVNKCVQQIDTFLRDELYFPLHHYIWEGFHRFFGHMSKNVGVNTMFVPNGVTDGKRLSFGFYLASLFICEGILPTFYVDYLMCYPTISSVMEDLIHEFLADFHLGIFDSGFGLENPEEKIRLSESNQILRMIFQFAFGETSHHVLCVDAILTCALNRPGLLSTADGRFAQFVLKTYLRNEKALQYHRVKHVCVPKAKALDILRSIVESGVDETFAFCVLSFISAPWTLTLGGPDQVDKTIV